MNKVVIPAFGEVCAVNEENRTNTVYAFSDIASGAFDAYARLFADAGYAEREYRLCGKHRFAALEGEGGDGCFLNYYEGTRELRIVLERNCRYFSYADTPLPLSVNPELTQVHLEDFGMSYVVRLSDGRYIVIDGGREFEPDADRLYDCLRAGTTEQTPVIASWIFTHPHSDHFHCLLPFAEKYRDKVTVQRAMLLFPECDDYAHFPTLAHKDRRFEDSSATTNIPRMMEALSLFGAEIFTLHTGQTYRIGDASCEVLSSMDDILHLSSNVNSSSAVIRMELAGQVILFAADASFEDTRLPERYSSYLKADILQVPHHGFQSGSAAKEIEGYRLIAPSVCLLPVSDMNAYTIFCTYRESARFLMTESGVGEIITGEYGRTLSLPYTPPVEAKEAYRHRYLAGRDNSGARTWVFTGLDTANPDDFRFTFLNMVNLTATVYAELYFEQQAQMVRYIKIALPAGTVRSLCITDENDVDGDALFFNWLSLKAKGVPQDVPFAVRFLSDVPIVVSHKTHRESYHSSYNF